MFYSLSVKSALVEAIISIGQGIRKVIIWLINLLPDDPFRLNEVLTVPESVVRVLSFINWLVPLHRCLQLTMIWFAVIAGIWIIRFCLKLAHVI